MAVQSPCSFDGELSGASKTVYWRHGGIQQLSCGQSSFKAPQKQTIQASHRLHFCLALFILFFPPLPWLSSSSLPPSLPFLLSDFPLPPIHRPLPPTASTALATPPPGCSPSPSPISPLFPAAAMGMESVQLAGGRRCGNCWTAMAVAVAGSLRGCLLARWSGALRCVAGQQQKQEVRW